MKRSAHVWIYKVQALLALFINSLVYLRAAEPIHILTTTTDLASIVREIGGEYVQVQSLCSGNEDPHRLVPRPSHMVAAHQADAWIRVGMFIEVGYEQAILEGARNPRIAPGGPGYFNASEGVLRLEVPKGPVDRSMGDVHPAGNPHYMLDPLNGRIVANALRATSVSYVRSMHRCLKSGVGIFSTVLIAACLDVNWWSVLVGLGYGFCF